LIFPLQPVCVSCGWLLFSRTSQVEFHISYEEYPVSLHFAWSIDVIQVLINNQRENQVKVS
jgi:hypothetical protein